MKKLIYSIIFSLLYLDYIDLYCIFVLEIERVIDIKISIIIMAQKRIYKIGCSGSGWGIWNTETGHKVMSCCSHYHAVESLYNLMGWKWNPAKYRSNY